MGVRVWVLGVVLGASVLGSACAGGEAGAVGTPWSLVTGGDVLDLTVAQDGAVAALVRGDRSLMAVSLDAAGVELRSRRVDWSSTAVALGGDRVLVFALSGVELHEGVAVTPLAVPPSTCAFDPKTDGRGAVHFVVVPGARASIGGEPVEAWRGYIVTVDAHGALRTLDRLQGEGCPALLAVSPAGHRLVRTAAGTFRFADGLYRRLPLIAESRLSYGARVTLADDGSVAIAETAPGQLADGTSSGSIDVRVTLLDASGHERWTRWVGGPGYDDVAGLARGADGRVYLAATAQGLVGSVVDPVVDFGAFRASIPASGSQTVIASWEEDGSLVWGAAPGGVRNDAATALALGAGGTLVLGGWFEGAMELPDGTHMAGGGRAGYVVALDP